MQAQIDIVVVRNILQAQADLRFKQIAMHIRGDKYNEACDALLQPLVYQPQNGETIYYGLQLPRCFPSMTEPDVLSILNWYITEGSIVRPGHDLLEVHANYGDILIPMHPSLHGRYQVVQIMHKQDAKVQMGDLLVVLQTEAQKTFKGRSPKRKVA